MPSSSKIEFNEIHPKDMTEQDWLEDLKSLFSLMKDNNPYLPLKERMLGYRWLNLYEGYRNRIRDSHSLEGYLEVIFDAVQSLQNGHSVIISPDWLDGFYDVKYYRETSPFCDIFSDELKKYYKYWEPILGKFLKKRNSLNYDAGIWYNNGDYFVEDGYGNWEEKYERHSRVIAVNDKPIDEAVRDCYEKAILNWDFKRKKFFLFRLAPRCFGLDAVFTIETKSGDEKKVVFETSFEYPYSLFTVYPAPRLETKVWPKKKAGYVRIGDFSDNLEQDDNKVLLEFYKTVEEFDLLIIDVRGNQGGSYGPWMRNVIAPLAKKKLSSKMHLAFRSGNYVEMFRRVADIGSIIPKESFKQLPPEVLTEDFTIYDYTQTVDPSGEIDFKGRIIVLIDAITFSATDAFALFCKETGFAKLYGIPTGGDGISDSPSYYILPNSKLLVRFTPGMGIDYTGQANEEVCVHPDVYHESPFGDMQELINFVLNHEL
ncbi:MAG: S41 family peptidase [Candidatus Hermodarchaeota archaeon]